MKYWAGCLVALISSVALSSEKLVARFGDPVTGKVTLSLDQVLASPKDHLGVVLVAEATVNKVCKQKGCWMEVSGGNASTRVTFKNYGFFVPQNLLNKKVKIQGRLGEKILSVKEQQHYLEDEGRPQFEISAIQAPKSEYAFVADGVELLGP